MAGRRQHRRKQNASERFRMWALPHVIETINKDLIAIISNTKAPMPHATYLTMMASY